MLFGMGMRRLVTATVLLLAVSWGGAQEKLAATPPMGWNSWDRMG